MSDFLRNIFILRRAGRGRGGGNLHPFSTYRYSVKVSNGVSWIVEWSGTEEGEREVNAVLKSGQWIRVDHHISEKRTVIHRDLRGFMQNLRGLIDNEEGAH